MREPRRAGPPAGQDRRLQPERAADVDSGASRSPERALWAMVLLTVLDDVEKPRHMDGAARARRRIRVQAEAMMFCHAPAGKWAAARAAVCDLAGIEVTAFQRIAAGIEAMT
jgi:hypothetical protein